jgi:hypothetical protein
MHHSHVLNLKGESYRLRSRAPGMPTTAGKSRRRVIAHVMAMPEQKVREWPVIIAGWLERDFATRRSHFKLISEFVEIRQRVSDTQGGPFAVR